MEKKQIFTLVGGISKNSLNKKLFRAMKEYAPKNFDLVTLELNNLPFFSQDLEYDPPDSVVEYKDLLRNADAILFITPEYNRSIPGVLKNAVDWGSRPYGQSLWDKKTAGVLGASAGNTGTMAAQFHLRQMLAYLNVRVMGQPEFYLNGSKVFNESGKLVDENTIKHVQKYWTAFEEWIELNEFSEAEGVLSRMAKGGVVKDTPDRPAMGA